MKYAKLLCLVLAMLLTLGGCLAEAGEELSAQAVDQPVEEFELSLAEDGIAAEDGSLAEDDAAVSAEAEEEPPAEVVETPVEPTVEPSVEPTAEPTPEPIVPQRIVVPKKVVLGAGERLQLEPEVQPADAVYDGIIYKSSNTKYVKVTPSGRIIAGKKSAGKTAYVVVKAGKVAVKIKVVVKKAPKQISLEADHTRLRIGETLQLTAALPKGAVGKYTWSVSPKGILDLSEDGLVEAIKPGKAKVTVRTYNNKKASVTLTVMPAFEITFMNIGRNDGILIQCDGEYAFIDSGMHGQGTQAVKYMKKQEIKHLKYYIGTHAHRDHVGGAPAVIAAFDTDLVIVSHSDTYKKIKDFAENDAERKATRAVDYRSVDMGDTFTLGSAKFEVLGPTHIYKCKTGDVAENANSLVLKLTYGKNSFLLTGDATGTEITEIERANPGCMEAQVLKNPHHNGQQKYIVQLCKPQIVIFSTSSGSLPSSSFLSYVRDRGADYYITSSNRDGDVIIASDGEKLTVTTEY